MAAALNLLARHARILLLVVPGLLTLGALLAMIGMPIVGWPIYALGHLGLLLALPALAAAYWASLDRLAWLGLAVAYVGVVLGVPVVLMLIGHHLQDPAGGDGLLGAQLTPLGVLAGAVTWIGFAFFGVAAYNARAVPRGGAVLLVVGALLALLAEIGVLAIPAWALGVLIASVALVWFAPPEDDSSRS